MQLTKLWDSTKKDEDSRRDKRGKKLTVEYEYPHDLQAIAGRLMESADVADDAREPVPQPRQAPAADTTRVEKQGTPEAVFAELQATRKKYDAVVEYTLTLTAERDMLSNKVS